MHLDDKDRAYPRPSVASELPQIGFFQVLDRLEIHEFQWVELAPSFRRDNLRKKSGGNREALERQPFITRRGACHEGPGSDKIRVD